jgi:signal transduction histidine kinase
MRQTHLDTGPVAIDQRRIVQFAAIGAAAAIVVLLGSWIVLDRVNAAPISGATSAAPCCPPDGAAATDGPPASETVASGPAWLFDTTGFPARWFCGTWSEQLGWMHILGDLSIWAAYMAIPIVLGVFVIRGGSPLPSTVWLFIAFIFTCGVGHLIESVIFYEPVYRLAGAWKWVIGIVSWATVASLLPTVPQVLRWPRLADLNTELVTLNDSLESERLRVEQANRRLKDTNEELEQFVYSASHDLKSPLVTISGFLTHLRRDLEAGHTENLQSHIDRIARSTNRMKSCVDDLLEVSRVGHVTEEATAVSLPETYRGVELLLRDRLQRAGFTMRSDFEVPVVHVTPSHLERALVNLVENAIRHAASADAPTLVVGSRREERETRIFVRDNGPGVPPEHHRRIFELFQRLSADENGTGVGLTIVMRVAAARGGRAWVESTPGEGATFWMSFPDPEPGHGEVAGRASNPVPTSDPSSPGDSVRG